MDNPLHVKLLLKYLKENKLTDSFNALSKECKTSVYTTEIEQNIKAVEEHNFASIREVTRNSQLTADNQDDLIRWVDLFEYVWLFIDNKRPTELSSYHTNLSRLQKTVTKTPLLEKQYRIDFGLLPIYTETDRIRLMLRGLGITQSVENIQNASSILSTFFKEKILLHYKEYSDLQHLDFKSIDTYGKTSSIMESIFPDFKLDSQMILNSGIQFELVKTISDFLDDIDFVTISENCKELFIVSKRQGLQRLDIKKCITGKGSELETILPETYSPKLEFDITGNVIIDKENGIDNSKQKQSSHSLKYNFNNYNKIIGRVHLSKGGMFLAADTSDKKVAILKRNKHNNFEFTMGVSEVLSYCFMGNILLCCNYKGIFGAFDLNIDEKRKCSIKVQGLSLIFGDKIPISMVYFPEIGKLYMLKLNGILDVWSTTIEDNIIKASKKESISTGMGNCVMGKFLTVNKRIILLARHNTPLDDIISEKITHLALFDVESKRKIVEYEGNQKAIKYFLYPSIDYFNFKYTLSGDMHGNIILWNTKTGKIIGTIKAHSCITNSTVITMLDETYYVFSSSDDRTLKVWRLIEDKFNTLPLIKQ